MINLFLILLGLSGGSEVSCPEPKFINESGFTLEERDTIALNAAKKGCKRFYGEESCLVKFIKKGKGNYYALCRDFDKDTKSSKYIILFDTESGIAYTEQDWLLPEGN